MTGAAQELVFDGAMFAFVIAIVKLADPRVLGPALVRFCSGRSPFEVTLWLAATLAALGTMTVGLRDLAQRLGEFVLT